MRWLITMCLSIFLLSAANGQHEQCQDQLIRAKQFYQNGSFQEALDQLHLCSDSTTWPGQWQVYRLKALCYLASSQTDSARKATEQMLNLNPTYRSDAFSDPVEFTRLVLSVTVIPRFTLGLAVSVGPNLSILKVSKSFVLGDYSKEYTPLFGYQAGVQFGMYLKPNLVLNSGLIVTHRRYDIQYSPVNWSNSVRSRLSYLYAPICVQHIFNPTQKQRYFAQIGPSIGHLLYASNDFSAQLDDGASFNLTRANMRTRRNSWIVGATAGIGVMYKLNQSHLSLQADYFYALNNINKTSERFNNTQEMYDFQYVDDDTRIHTLAIVLGYAFHFNYHVYHPKSR